MAAEAKEASNWAAPRTGRTGVKSEAIHWLWTPACRARNPRRGPPISPVTQSSSPAFAPPRRMGPGPKQRPVSVSDKNRPTGLDTVSPPIRPAPQAESSSPSAAANPARSASGRLDGQPSVSSASDGSAPLARMSDTFTRTSLRAMESIGSLARKWTPSTIASVVITTAPLIGDSSAVSSVSLAAPGAVASGAK